MKTLSTKTCSKVHAGAIFGPATINGQDSMIVMLKNEPFFYYYDFDHRKGYYFKQDGSVQGPEGTLGSNHYRTFINHQGYRSFFVPLHVFDFT